MLKRYYPGSYADSVFDIDFDSLYDKGYRGILFDVDNTLVHHGDDSNPRVDAFFQKLHQMGFATVLLSNNSAQRLERFKKNIDTQYVAEAGKPRPEGYLRAVAMLNLAPEQVICIGDQIFTDIVGANRSAIASILVHYIQTDPDAPVGIRRKIEKIILWFWKRRK